MSSFLPRRANPANPRRRPSTSRPGIFCVSCPHQFCLDPSYFRGTYDDNRRPDVIGASHIWVIMQKLGSGLADLYHLCVLTCSVRKDGERYMRVVCRMLICCSTVIGCDMDCMRFGFPLPANSYHFVFDCISTYRLCCCNRCTIPRTLWSSAGRCLDPSCIAMHLIPFDMGCGL